MRSTRRVVPSRTVPNRTVTLWFAAFLLSSALSSSAAWGVENLQGSCSPGPTTLCLLNDRFSVEVDWEDSGGMTGDGQVVSSFSSNDTGFFYFTDAEQVSTYVRILDGTKLNGFFWVYYASLTDFQFTITITDTVIGGQAIYDNPLGSFTSVTDTEAIADVPLPASSTREGLIGIPVTKTSSKVSGSTEKGVGGSCATTATALCLDQGRFEVTVDWVLPEFQGGMGPGMTIPLTDQSGAFWFFTPSNIELAVKIHDGGNGFYWFAAGATTSIEYTITVTDTCSGEINSYQNPQGALNSFGDFEAFATGVDCGVFTDGFETGDLSQWSSAVGN